MEIMNYDWTGWERSLVRTVREQPASEETALKMIPQCHEGAACEQKGRVFLGAAQTKSLR